MTPAGFLALALLSPTAPPAAAPRLQRGDELTYTGTVSEVVERPGHRFRRGHALEVRVLVLDRQDTWADAAVLTLLRRDDDPAVSGALPTVTGANTGQTAVPPAARLDLVRVHEDGTVHLLTPPGPAPLRFDARTPAWAIPPVPLDSFAPFEFGMFPPRQPAQGVAWSVASTARNRPAEAWEANGLEFVNQEQCAKLTMTQQSADWLAPRGGLTSWQRADAVWASTRDGTARRVRRVIRQRDGIARDPAVCIEVQYELKDRGRLIGRTYDRYRVEVETAFVTAAELAPLLPDAARLGPDPFKVRLARLDAYLEETEPGTPYREAVRAVRRRLDDAASGKVIPAAVEQMGRTGEEEKRREDGPRGSSPPLPDSPSPPLPKTAPDFRAGAFHLADARGKPVVLVFFMPGRPTADLSLAIADALRKQLGSRLVVAPLAVFADAASGEKDRDRLKLTVPVYDGSAAVAAYGVETFPRIVLIDAAGAVRWSFAGVGAETGFLLREQVNALLNPPVGAVGATGTTSRAGPPGSPSSPRP